MTNKFLFQNGEYLKTEKMEIYLSENEENIIHHQEGEDLSKYPLDATPVGSVEFCSALLEAHSIETPKSISYLEQNGEIQPFLFQILNRKVYKTTFENAPEDYFVKPFSKIKSFTGNIKSKLEESVSQEELVWTSEPIDFHAEYRIYVCEGKVLGGSRYDDTDYFIEIEDELLKEAEQQAKLIIETIEKENIKTPVAYTIDIGFNPKKEILLIEFNDAWALGYYKWGDMKISDYKDMIQKRWKEIVSK